MDKIALQFGGWTIHWFGVFVAGGFLLGLWTAGRRGLKQGIPREAIVDAGTWLILGAVVGARALYVLTNWSKDFADKPIWEIFMIHHGGLVFYGGFLGATVAGYGFVRARRLAFWKLADTFAPSIALGHALGRFGCLMNGCCYGHPCQLPWAVHFPLDHETQGAGVHPTQIYEAFLNFGLYLGLAWFYDRKQFDGQVFSFYLMAYALLRGFVELFRGDYPADSYLFGGDVSQAQLLSIALFCAGAWISRSLRPPAARKSISLT